MRRRHLVNREQIEREAEEMARFYGGDGHPAHCTCGHDHSLGEFFLDHCPVDGCGCANYVPKVEDEMRERCETLDRHEPVEMKKQ